MNISVPSSLKSWIDRQVTAGGFETASEFIRHLIRTAKDREALREAIDDELEIGLDSGFTPMRRSDWADIRREGKRQLAKLAKRRKSA